MATINVTVCDECGRQKQESNHWMIIGCDVESPQLFKSEKEWKDYLGAGDDLHLDYCSQKCLTSVLGRWMDTGSIEKPPPTVYTDTIPAEVGEDFEEGTHE